MRGARARWAVALRIARRSALASWGRSLLIVTLIAVPIIGLSAGAVVLPSLQSTLEERIQGNLGHAQAKLTVVDNTGRAIQQGREGGYSFDESKPDGKDLPTVDPRTVLPAGTRTIAVTTGAATFATPKGETSLVTVTGETWDPSLDGGPYELLSGRRPTADDEVLLSPAALSRLGADVGGTVEMLQPTARTLRVVGTSRDRSLPTSTQSVFGAESLLPVAESVPDTFYVPTARIGWPVIEKLNAEAGTTVLSRTAVVQPSAYAQRYDGFGSSFWDVNFGTSLVVAMALAFAVLEVALLAGSAFLVGARLQQRSLATVASVGADRSVLRRIVTANGVVLGGVGGVAGVGLGIVGAVVFMRVTDDGAWTRYPGLHLWWPLLIGIAVFGVVVGWIAALVPARAASRFDIVRALRGARTPQKVGKRPVVGVVLLIAGIVLTLLGGVALVAAQKLIGPSGTLPQIGAAALLCGGPVLAQLGVLLCSGLMLRGVSSLLRRAPLAARLAARDTSRNLGRAVPAVASVMTTVFIAAFVMCIANSASIMGAVTYYWTLAKPGSAVSYISSDDPTSTTADRWSTVLRHDLPVDRMQVIGQTLQGTDDPTPSNRHRDALAVVRVKDSICPEPSFTASDTRCGPYSATGGTSYSSQYPLVVGDESALALLLGHAPSTQAVTTLRDGGVVALRTGLVHGSRVQLDWFTPKQLANGVESATPVRSKAIPAVVDLPTHAVQDALFTTTSTARSLHLTVRPDRVLLDFTKPPTDAELDTANTAIAALANDPSLGRTVYIETGPQDYGGQIAWLILLACLVIAICAGATAIALARVDARADDMTLASLGASPRVRKSVASVQALIICGVGAVIGTALGLLPAVAVGIAAHSLPFAPPPLQLTLMAVGIPVVIAAGSWMMVGTRRGDLTRRTAIA
ncbi:hypothetical protein [uncultured Amnibacterium sp.]|uniref:hypothetical protein n=1 Tax=uncultured Amnibacterium sp. TaxID=1631851 RepID=UPI0035CC274A